MNANAAPGSERTDVLVLGSGAAGLAAALTAAVAGARVRLLEASAKIGGTTTWSGGMVWIPTNHRMAAAGLEDSRQAALEYLSACLGDTADPDLVAAFLDRGPEAVRFIEERSDLRLIHSDYPDSLTELPGALERGRNLTASAFPRRSLGSWKNVVRRSPGPIRLNVTEFYEHGFVGSGWIMFKRKLTDRVSAGTALVCGLLKACLDHGVEISINARATELIEEDGRVVGARAQVSGGTLDVHASGGVVLATGSFDWNTELVDRFLPLGSDEIRLGNPPSLRGDGLLMAQRLGANLVHMDEAWWWPVAAVPNSTYEGQPIGRMVIHERTRPHSIVVNRDGKRFTNEAQHNFALTLFERNERGELRNQPAWAVFDRQFRKKYLVAASLLPYQRDPSWLLKAESLTGLAEKMGIAREGLRTTVERWNALCDDGVDVDFGRGQTFYERHNGDLRLPQPNLGRIEKPPFYALQVYASPVGTKGGPQIDASARVLRQGGEPVPGLYAAGNVAGRLVGPGVYGAGVTLGPGMTFGYLAGRHAAAEAAALRTASISA